ncbi:hypothetical protein GGS26DRAFT_29685 [Hypomontagnella submonticulosa]|nr:hypothetical protein GGS26DRAFT_29685 [Hypomontagnella submonticulosa]
MKNNILDPRIPKGGGKGFKISGGGGGGGGSNGGPLPLWAEILIAFGVVWICFYFVLFFHFFRRDYINAKAKERRRLSIGLCGHLAWKTFKYATLIQVMIWAARKAIERCKAGRSRKKVGGTVYRKVDEEKGETDGSESIGIPPASVPASHPGPI